VTRTRTAGDAAYALWRLAANCYQARGEHCITLDTVRRGKELRQAGGKVTASGGTAAHAVAPDLDGALVGALKRRGGFLRHYSLTNM